MMVRADGHSLLRRSLARPWVRDGAALAVLALVWFGFYWRFLPIGLVPADARSFPTGDFWQQFYVFRNFAYETLRAGQLPLWMPCVFAGYPYQADPQTALFYPATWLSFGLGALLGGAQLSRDALQLEALLHVLLAACGMYAFLRGEVRGRTSALAGALVFGFGGYLTGYPPLQLAILESAAWLPVSLLSLRRVLARGRWRDVALLGLTWGIIILAGHPQTAMLVFYAGLAYGVWHLLLPGRQFAAGGRARAGARMVISLALAATLAAVQLVPTLEYVRLSTRAGITYEQAATGFPLQDVLQFIVPGFVSEWQPLYAGLLPLALAAYALLAWRRGEGAGLWFWAALGLGGLILAFGKHAFGYDVGYLLAPGYDLFRSQERHALWVAVALAVLAAHGADRLCGALSRRRRRVARGVGRTLVIGAVLLFVLLGVVTYLKRLGYDPSDRGRLPAFVGMAFLVMTLSAALWAARLRGAPIRTVQGLAVALIAFDLLSAGRDVNAGTPGPLYPLEPALQPILEERAGGSAFRVQEDGLLPMHALCAAGLDEVGGGTPIRLASYGKFVKRAPEAVRWDVLAVQYLVTQRDDLHTADGEAVAAAQVYAGDTGAGERITYRLDRPARLGWLVYDIVDAATDSDLYAALSQPGFDAFETAVLRAAHAPAVDPGAMRGEVKLAERRVGWLAFDVDAPAPGLLAASESFYPGWSATVDGLPQTVVQVDGVVLGVEVTPGRHHVVFEYRPVSLLIGAIISAGALLIIVVLLVRVQGSVRSTAPAGSGR